MTKKLFISLPVADLAKSVAFYKAIGFTQDTQMSESNSSRMVWSDAISVMLLTHEKWRGFTQRPFPAEGTASVMLSLSLENREAVDAMNEAAKAHGGQADVNPVEDHGFMYGRDLADPDGHLWGAFWMDAGKMG